MRGDGLGVGDIGEVHGDARSSRDATDGDDGGGARRERDASVVGGPGVGERDAGGQCRGDRIGVGDGTWVGHGADGVHGGRAMGKDEVRGDGVGVGDVGEVPGGTGGTGDAAGGDDGRTLWKLTFKSRFF